MSKTFKGRHPIALSASGRTLACAAYHSAQPDMVVATHQAKEGQGWLTHRIAVPQNVWDRTGHIEAIRSTDDAVYVHLRNVKEPKEFPD
ncbi:MAG: hypothetical protein LLG06_10750, partial [Desulfobacteraceae bacterium]|nr:hypothetical protein [Desulfobacteraceae bacterium]